MTAGKSSGKKQFDVAALGELLVDMTQNGISKSGSWCFEANPGGAPCNVLAMLCKLGKKTAFIGKTGDDMFGRMLKDTVSSLGIDTQNLVMTKTEKTALAFVHTDKAGERSFSFYRENGADTMLKKSDIKKTVISSSKIFHFGSLSMTDEPANEATEYAVETAEKANVIISFDPNLRPLLWKSSALAKEKIRYGISKCDVLKIADEELEFVTGAKSIAEGVALLRRKYEMPLITVTKGKKGSEFFYDDGIVSFHESCPAFLKVHTIDTTGAGDTFCACVLNNIIEYGFNDFTKERLADMARFASAAAALVTTKQGALLSMPSVKEINNLLSNA